MAEQYQPNIGHTPEDKARRDAIHIAVAPVVAAQDLLPGSSVRLNASGEAFYSLTESIGIVDPFALQKVNQGDKFWLFLYPNTITSLRHVWSHPAFETRTPRVKESKSDE